MAQFNYRADGSVIRQFMSSDAFVRGIRGPVGSGKSVCCAVEIFKRSLAQAKSPDGIRRTRWAVVRNTNPQLRTTTIKTWLDWFPEDTYGKFNWSPPFNHRIRRGELDIEVYFLALDKPEDVKKLLSLELTGGWINEAREVPKAIVDALTMRCGRYPSVRDGGCTWQGVIMDTNAPDEDHWWPIMSGDVPLPDYITTEEALMLVKPRDWEFYSQPGAMLPRKEKGEIVGYEMNPLRENQVGIKDAYYTRIIGGKGKDWINVYVCNLYGALTDGKPVYVNFDRNIHVAKEWIPFNSGVPITIGIDFGLTPAAVFNQNVRGRWLTLHELVCRDMGAARFAELLRKDMASFGGADFNIYGDPAGDQRAQTDEDTPFRILRAAGIKAIPAPSNDIALRIEAVNAPLVRLVDKKPGRLIDPRCLNLIKGMEGGYSYRKLNVSGSERHEATPDKSSRFSHVCDADQYSMLGGGEGRALMRSATPTKVVQAARTWDVFANRKLQNRKPQIKGW